MGGLRRSPPQVSGALINARDAQNVRPAWLSVACRIVRVTENATHGGLKREVCFHCVISRPFCCCRIRSSKWHIIPSIHPDDSWCDTRSVLCDTRSVSKSCSSVRRQKECSQCVKSLRHVQPDLHSSLSAGRAPLWNFCHVMSSC